MNNGKRFLLATLLAGLMFGVTGCGGSGGGGLSTRSEADLQASADQAETDSGLTDFAAVTPENVNAADEQVTSVLSSVAGEAFSTAGVTTSDDINFFGASVPSPKRMIRRIVMQDFGQRYQTSTGAASLDETYPLDVTVNCSVSGTATVTGTVHMKMNGSATATGGTIKYNYSIDDLLLVLDACETYSMYSDSGTVKAWGTHKENASEKGSFIISETVWTTTWDEKGAADGGLVFTDGTTNMKVAYTETFTSQGSATYDFTTDTETYDSFKVNYNSKINDVTCTFVVNSYEEYEASTGPTCQ